LLPAIRQLISIPAGLARMNLARFCLWTTIGAGLWVFVLTFTGYLLGDASQRLWSEHKHEITIGLFALGTLIVAGYVAWHYFRPRRVALVTAKKATE
jgi:membrane protein DedA with SNARE-associated domain